MANMKIIPLIDAESKALRDSLELKLAELRSLIMKLERRVKHLEEGGDFHAEEEGVPPGISA